MACRTASSCSAASRFADLWGAADAVAAAGSLPPPELLAGVASGDVAPGDDCCWAPPVPERRRSVGSGGLVVSEASETGLPCACRALGHGVLKANQKLGVSTA